MAFTTIANAALVYAWIANRELVRHWTRGAAFVCMVAVFWFHWHAVSTDVIRAQRVHASEAKMVAAVKRLRHTEKCITISYYNAPVLSQALYFGSGFSGRVYADLLSRMYPKHLSYNYYGGGFFTFKTQVPGQSIYDGVRQGQCVLLYGGQELTPETFPLARILDPVPVVKYGPGGGVYRLVVKSQ